MKSSLVKKHTLVSLVIFRTETKNNSVKGWPLSTYRDVYPDGLSFFESQI